MVGGRGVLTHRGQQRHFRSLCGAEDDDCGPVLVAQPIRHLPQGLDVDAVDAAGEDVHTADSPHAVGHVVALRPGQLALQAADLFFQRALLGEQFFQARDRVLVRAAQDVVHAVQHPFAAPDPIERRGAGHRLDPPHPRSHARLGLEFEQADVAGSADVGAAAQFGREIPHAQHPHPVAVLLPEEGQRALFDRLAERHFPAVHLGVRPHVGVDAIFDLGQPVRLDRAGVGEIEAQPVGRDQRSGLPDVRAQNLAQHRVQNVGGRMVQAYRLASRGVDVEADRVACPYRALHDPPAVHGQVRLGLARVHDFDQPAIRGADRADVAHLSTGLAVERGLGRNQVDDFALAYHSGPYRPVHQQREHFGFVLGLPVAHEPRLHVRVHAAQPDGKRGFSALARAFALLLHRPPKPVPVDVQPLGRQHVLGQLERKPVRVVQSKRRLSGQRRRSAAAQGGEFLLEQGEPRRQRVRKTGFLPADDVADVGTPVAQFRVCVAQQIGHAVGHLREERSVEPEQPAVAQGAAHDAAQHVAAALVGRHHAVGNGERRGPGVVGNDPKGNVSFRGVAVPRGRQPFGEPDDVAQQVGIVVARHVLQHRDDALQAHPGVHVGCGQRVERPVGVAVVLDEDQIPEFDEARTAGVDLAAVAGRVAIRTRLRAAVDVNLRARAARAGLAHFPEIVLFAEP